MCTANNYRNKWLFVIETGKTCYTYGGIQSQLLIR